MANLAAPGPRIELKSDLPELAAYCFSENGVHLAARTWGSLRVWNVETGQVVVSVDRRYRDAIFAMGGRVLVVAVGRESDHEIDFYDLAHPTQAPRSVPGRHGVNRLAVSPDGALVAASTAGGLVRLFDAARCEWVADLHGHMNSVAAIAFSPSGRRLISTSSGGREAVKLWDVGTRQELLTLSGTSSLLDNAKWSADGDMILAGLPWQAWRAPSWEEIAEAEAKEKTEIERR